MGIALPLFIESNAELVDVELLDNISCEDFKNTLTPMLPNGCKIISIQELENGALAIDQKAQWAEYKISLVKKDDCNLETFMYNCDRVLSSEEILLTKKNKKGLLKTSNIKSSIQSYQFKEDSLFVILKSGQGSEIPAVRADDLMKLICENIIFDIKRLRFFDENLLEL